MFCPDCGTWNRANALRCSRCEGQLPELPGGAPAEQPDDEITALRRVTGSRYRIAKRLASGGMAHVYLGQHDRLGRAVVIKVLHGHLAKDPEMRERFRREAESACQLLHPNICTILDYGDVDGAVHLVMPYLAGGSLADR